MMNKNMSDHNFVLFDQDGVLVGHMSFQVKKNYLQPCRRPKKARSEWGEGILIFLSKNHACCWENVGVVDC